ncbi:hydrogenase 3 maturation endopeptidase HyCI [Methanochimaera problematica]|nr:hydrogenase 3 maturation endopeptidase HyCI [Methanoplanus sp. FWC-SCC4]
MGVGNTLRNDDGAGIYLAENFSKNGWISLVCGTTPENFTGIVRRENTKILVIVDAADMGLSPGEFRIIPEDMIEYTGFDTHIMDLKNLINFLRDITKEIILVGIQPKDIDFGECISPEVMTGIKLLTKALYTDPHNIQKTRI